MKATLDLPEYPDRKFQATIVTNSHGVDQKSRTLLVELLADNNDGLLSRARSREFFFNPMPTRTFQGTIPASALLYRNNALQVATLGLDNQIALRQYASRATSEQRSKSLAA